MTSLGAYESLLLKVNRNDRNSNIHIPRGRFVNIFNEQQRNWLKDTLHENLGTDDIDQLNDLLVDDVSLERVKIHRDHVEFELPDDFYSFSSAYCLASTEECKDRPLVVWNVKPKNARVLLLNENESPSFEYEETICSISNQKVRIYFDDFQIEEAFLNYYRFAKDIDLEGYVKIDNTPSITIDPELSDAYVDEIINRCAAEIMRNVQNQEGFGFAKERIQTEK